MTFKKLPPNYDYIMKDNRYLYDIDYSVYTVKEQREKILNENVKIPSNELLDTEKLTELISEMLHHLIESQMQYDNYDIVRLEGVSLKVVYDSAI